MDDVHAINTAAAAAAAVETISNRSKSSVKKDVVAAAEAR